MRIFKKSISCILAFVMTFSLCANVSFADSEERSLKGFVVNSLNNLDFPSQSNLSLRAISQEIKDILSFAKENDFNAVVLEVRPDDGCLYKSEIYPTSDFWLQEKGKFTFYDLSKDFIKKASKENIDVYAMINLGLSDPLGEYPQAEIDKNLKDLENLSRKYGFSGVVIKDLPISEGLDYDKLLTDIKTALGDLPLGVLYAPKEFSEDDQNIILKDSDFVIPVLEEELAFRNHGGYIAALEKMREKNPNVIPFSDLGKTNDVTAELSSKHYEALKEGFDSFIFNSYTSLRNNENMQLSLLSTVNGMKDTIDTLNTGYTPVKQFGITRPEKPISTPYSTYFIMGTSNPESPVYFNGQQVERFSEDGLFGVKVKLAVGNNSFTFSQGGVTKNVNITRYSASEENPATINKITKAFPTDSAIFKNNEEGTISCIAPSGGKVYAVVDGKTVAMEQGASAQRGVPALYKGTVSLNGASSEEVKSLGNITYHLTFDGNNTSYTSKGKLYLKGENAEAKVRTKIIFANVLTPDLKFGDFKAIYKEGTTEETVGMTFANNDWYYELKSGGFIKASDVDVIESNKNSGELEFSELSFAKEKNKEIIRLKGISGLPYYFDEKEDGSTVLNLYGKFSDKKTEELASYLSQIDTTLYSSVSAKKSENGIEITFVPNKDIWGLDVIYDGDDTLILSKTKAEFSADIKRPLENLTVVIDPGHGGIDSGALGVLGTNGPMEKDVNLLNSFVLKQRLEMLGAKVVLTREKDDENPSLLERANTAYLNDADIFISIHHNSIAEAADGNDFHGVEAYYYENFGKRLAELVPQKISQNTSQRDYRKTEGAYYVVTKMRCAPAILNETGFVPSPFEYERICSADEIFKTSEAITAAILEFMK